MFCENCKQNLATAFSSIFVDGVQQEFYLCQTCLKEKKLSSKETIFSKEEFDVDKLCICGTSFKDILESGYVNCKECYKTFEQDLEPVILRLHTKNKHKGKRKLSKIEILFEQLHKAKENNFVSLANKIQNEIDALKGGLND